MDMTSDEAGAAVRDWAAGVIRSAWGEADVRATVETDRVNEGLPHIVGPPQNPAGIQTQADRWRLTVRLPPEEDEERVEAVLAALYSGAEADETLGGRVRGSRIPTTSSEPDREDSRDLGPHAWKVILLITTYRVEGRASS